MRNFFIFNGKPSTDFGVWCSGADTMAAPAPLYDTTQVPGKNGVVLTPKKSFENATVKYGCFMYRDFKEKFAALKSALLAEPGYKRLEDTFHPDEYREAYVSAELEPSLTDDLDSGTFTITFSCKPQRFLKSGEQMLTFKNKKTTSFINPCSFSSRPLIRIYFTASAAKGNVYDFEFWNEGESWDLYITLPEFTSTGRYFELDCEKRTVVIPGITSAASYLEVKNEDGLLTDFPELTAGQNCFSFDSWTGVSKIEIVPRWWRL